MRAGFTGAASIPPAVGQRFRQVTGCNLFEVYGMTEASGLIATDSVASAGCAGSVGFRLPYTEVVVRRSAADASQGEPCDPGEIGVITVRGPHVSPGYRDPEHDAGVFEGGGLNTGDLGYTDESGHIHIAGRVKDLIIRSGHNIDPLMIENAMASHPAVALAAAVGMPDHYAGELPVCYVMLRPGATASEEELHEHARRTIGERPAWPTYIHIVEAIPLTLVGKIYKPQLRRDATTRLVRHLMRERLAVPGAQVEATTGGPRGMRVTVTLPAADRASVPTVEQALAGYLFDADVRVE